MHNHTGPDPKKPAKPKPSTKDPHAGHDMGKPEKPGTPQKGTKKK